MFLLLSFKVRASQILPKTLIAVASQRIVSARFIYDLDTLGRCEFRVALPMVNLSIGRTSVCWKAEMADI